MFNKQISVKSALIVLIIVAAAVFLAVFWNFKDVLHQAPISFLKIFAPAKTPSITDEISGSKSFEKFSSEAEFKEYLKKGEEQGEYSGGIGGFADGGIRMQVSMEAPLAAPMAAGEKSAVPERVSETTVQVAGIDEPDIVKTDGKEIYFSRQPVWGWRGPSIMPPPSLPGRGISFEEQMKIMPPYPTPEAKTSLIKAFPPADLKIDGNIAKSGDLLLSGNILAVFQGQEIFGYDVSDPKSPQEKWKIKLENNNSLVASRLYKDKIYLVAKNIIDEIRPCPIMPLTAAGAPLEIKCADIYHPILPIPTDVVFIAMILDPASGKIENKISFVGSSGQSIIYMSEKALYATYYYQESVVGFFANFLKEKCRDLFPQAIISKIEKLETYDISQQAKLVELQDILGKHQNSLDNDERLKIENEMTNRMSDYYKAHKRDLEKTGIVKIGLDGSAGSPQGNFEIKAAGSAPGYPLNQFALDEYKDNLRIAVTVGERGGFWGFGFGGGRAESSNDVYVLDKDLKIQGSVLDMGKTERIYSVRFIEDKGYVVTFRQTDPFYVLDLSDPKNPALKGELKIPGYSAYLHPIDKDKILGMGKEGSQIKISLFDVKDAANPKEAAKYILDEYWSDILNTHHAFLLDKKHNIFFLPGSKGGYVFSYKNDPDSSPVAGHYGAGQLKLIKAISGISAKRAIYINDYLYIIGEDKITVINEIDWEKVNELSL